MKRLLSTSFIALGLFIAAAGAAPAAHALTACSAGSCFSSCTGSSSVVPGSAACELPPAGSGQAGVCCQSTSDAGAAGATNNKDLGPSSFNGVMGYVAQLFAWLVGVASITLDNAVYYTVVNMGSYVKNLSAVGVTWRILRDIGNIVLIFGFLAAGIATILNVNLYGWGKKMLPMLLIAAVFLNFSLFLSEAVIDAGNLFATQFYTEINGNNPAGAKTFGLSSINNEGISNTIMTNLGLQTIYGAAQNKDKAKQLFDNYWTVGFMSIILFIITAFVMFSLAFILIARFVILLFLIIVAPIGFAGLIVPKLDNTAKKWWSTLFQQTITAPILLLLLYIALAVITDANFLTGFSSCTAGAMGSCQTQVDYTGFATGNFGGFASVILSFLVAMGLLAAVVVVSKRMSAFGGSWATKTAGALSFGATAWAGRTTIGWGASRTAKYLRTTKLARVPLVGTGIVKGFERVSTASFDARGVKAGGGLKGGLKIDAGDAQKGGYRADLKARIKSRTDYAAELTGRELTDKEKAEQTAKQNQIKQLQKNRAKERDPVQIEKIDTQIKNLEKELEGIEKETAVGAQRDYASWLNLRTDPKGTFNTYFNFAANAEAAKNIRTTAKKAKPDKDWNANMKNLLKEAAKEAEEDTGGGAGTATPPPTGASPSGGGGGNAPATPSSGEGSGGSSTEK